MVMSVRNGIYHFRIPLQVQDNSQKTFFNFLCIMSNAFGVCLLIAGVNLYVRKCALFNVNRVFVINLWTKKVVLM